MPLRLAYQGSDGWNVYENVNALPRAFVVHRALAAANPEEAFDLLQADGFDPHRQVILETSKPLPPLESNEATAETVAIIKETPTAISMTVDVAANGFLVVVDTYYPGWRVYINGQPQEILQANTFARAVYLTPGQHTVEFVYQPDSFKIGLILNGIGLVLLAGTIYAGRRHKRNE